VFEAAGVDIRQDDAGAEGGAEIRMLSAATPNIGRDIAGGYGEAGAEFSGGMIKPASHGGVSGARIGGRGLGFWQGDLRAAEQF
jgi:hypothetical protein